MPTEDARRGSGASSLRLWQLISPALPVGAFAWSDGLESAVDLGWVRDEPAAREWILGQLAHVVASVDVPLFARLHRACSDGDGTAFGRWSNTLTAFRTTGETRAADRHLGTALGRLLDELGVPCSPGPSPRTPSFAGQFARACAHWDVCIPDGARGYVWAWAENQVGAAVKLVPLGQTAGQRLLMRAGELIPGAVAAGLALADDAIGALAPAVNLSSAAHETQYSRLFRS